MVTAFDISASGLSAQRLRMNIIANNLANINTTSSQRITYERDGVSYIKHIPYRRKEVLFAQGMFRDALLDLTQEPLWGVCTPAVVDDMTEFRKAYEPWHPHAVKDPNDPDFGYVLYPNVDPIIEMVDMIAASRAYEANIAAIDAEKAMGAASLRILG
jgi:flagellar basal-body rod protein FlgC